MKVQNGHTVTVHYTGTLPDEDNIEFDSSHGREGPIQFEVGSGRMIQGFNDALLGMTVGDVRNITLTPEEAYGHPEEAAFQNVPKEKFGEGFDFKLNGMIQGNGPMGPFIARIHEIQDDSVVLDFNHPMAGKVLTFDIELLSAV